MKQYIDKSALVAEIEKCYNECLKKAKITDSDYWNAKADAYRNVLVFLNDYLEAKEVDIEQLNKLLNWWKEVTTEHSVYKVKEVDLEKEVIDWWNTHYSEKDYTFERYAGHYLENSTVIEIAKHFFELGVNAKGE